jgi:hypothetical protein
VGPPTLDLRTFQDLLSELTRSAGRFAPEWSERARDDAGMVLAAVYAHYLEILLDRLNRVPVKNFLAFLDLLGVGRLPPGAARAPVVFTLAPAAGAAGFVPAGTQVATVQTATEPAVVYETEEDLNVVAALVADGHVIEPDRDRHRDLTAVVTGQDPMVFSPFRGDRPIDHVLYLGSDPLLLMRRAGQLDLTFRQPAPDFDGLEGLLGALAWEVSGEGGWVPLPQAPAMEPLNDGFLLSFGNFPGAALAAVAGVGLPSPRLSRWLRARLTRPISDFLSGENPILQGFQVDSLQPRVRQQTDAGVPPDLVLVNAVPVDFSKDFRPLGDNPRVGDTFYLASTEALAKTEPAAAPGQGGEVMLVVDVNLGDASLRWQYLRDQGSNGHKFTWADLEVDDGTGSFSRDGDIPFTLKADAAEVKPIKEGNPFRFVRVTLAAGNYARVPGVSTFRIVEAPQIPGPGFTSEFPRDAVDSSSGAVDPTDLVPLNLRGSFYPFGLTPAADQTFYFGVPPRLVFTAENPAKLQVVLTRQTARLTWEYLGAQGWTLLGTSAAQQGGPPAPQPPFDFVDATAAFTQAGTVSFRRPPDLVSGPVNGQANFWIRARLTAGYYGRPLEFIAVDAADPRQGFRPRPGTGAVNAPVVHSVLLRYTATDPSPVVLTQNGFALEDETARNAPGGETYPPFEPVEEKEPTFYLGFDRPLPNDAINLYFIVPPRQLAEVLTTGEAAADAGEPKLLWQYWNGRAWAELVVVDETRSLTESGGVQFLGPTDQAALARFDVTPRYWICIRRVQGGEGYNPLLSGVLLNAVSVVQATTVTNEVLGSSSGRRNQTYRLTQSPVFTGQQVLVREPEHPSDEEEKQLRKEEGEGVVQVRKAADGGQEFWVRWHEVASLAGSGARGRHYTLDRISGAVAFGDGVHGLVPPEGRDNVVAAVYRAGGGAAGNQPPGAISQLKSSIPYISAVTNPVPADGGSDAETLAEVQERGPQILRNRGRAVAAEDFEWLARQAAGTRVARARCLPNRNRDLIPEHGWVTVLLVPHGTQKKLLPSAELVRAVEDDLAGRSLALLTSQTASRINVIGPGYLPVEVAATVVPVSLPRADAARRAVLAALDEFLHSLDGGPDGTGWEFGRDVYLSELFAAFEALPDVEHVHGLTFQPTVATLPLTFTPLDAEEGPSGPRFPRAPVEYPFGSTLSTADEKVRAVLTEPIEEGASVSSAMGVLFQEGEQIRVGSGTDAVEVLVRSISGNTLTVDPFRAPADYPGDTPVVAVRSAAQSVLLDAIARDTRVTRLVVRGFGPDERVTLAPADGGPALDLTLAGVGEEGDRRLVLGNRLRVPPFALVYSGTHSVAISPG